LAIVSGFGAAALSFRLLPPLSPAFRTRRLLTLTLRDLHRVIARTSAWTVEGWQGRGFGRLIALPNEADRLQRSHLLAALLVGAEIIRVHRIAFELGLNTELEDALGPLSRGDVTAATAGFAALDRSLAARGVLGVLRARARVLAISEALTQHAAYFEMEAA
jgi:hypothetical protein